MMLTNREQINAVLFGNKPQSVRNYFQEQYDRLENIIQTFNPRELGTSLIRSAGESLRRTLDNNYVTQVGTFLNNFRHLRVESNKIHPIGFGFKFYRIKHTPLTQQYVMANPKLISEYRIGNICGYEGSYVDLEPSVDPLWREDYLNAIDGIVMEKDDEDYWYEVVTATTEDSLEHLTIDQQVMVMDNWNIANRLLRKGKDPTK